MQELVVPLETAQGMSGEDQKKAEALETIKTYAATLDPKVCPEVIVIYRPRDPDSQYVVMSHNDLCYAPGAKKNKGCATRVRTLIDEVFMSPTPRAPRKAKEKKDPAAPKENGNNKSPKGK
jgi:hypothetical protein